MTEEQFNEAAGDMMQKALQLALINVRRRDGEALAHVVLDHIEAGTAELVVEMVITGHGANFMGHIRGPAGARTVLDFRLIPPPAAAPRNH